MPYTPLNYGTLQNSPPAIPSNEAFGPDTPAPGGTFGALFPRYQQVTGYDLGPAQNPLFFGSYSDTPEDAGEAGAGQGYIGELMQFARSTLPGALPVTDRIKMAKTAELLSAAQAESAYDAERRRNVFGTVMQALDARIPDSLNRNMALGQGVLDNFSSGMNQLSSDTDQRRDNSLAAQSQATANYGGRLQDLLSTVAGAGSGMMSDVNRNYGAQDAAARESLASRGLTNPDILQSVLGGVESDRQRELLGVQEQLQEQALGTRQRGEEDRLESISRGLDMRSQYDRPLLSQMHQGLGQAAQIGETQRGADTALASDLVSRRLGFLADEMNRDEAPDLNSLLGLALQAGTAAPFPQTGENLTAGSLAGLL